MKSDCIHKAIEFAKNTKQLCMSHTSGIQLCHWQEEQNHYVVVLVTYNVILDLKVF